MKCAVLCNGPSRTMYQPSPEYAFVMGCNIPWTKVDATVVLDTTMIEYWYNNPDAITVPTYIGSKGWEKVKQLRAEEFFNKYLIEVIKVGKELDSSGHNAVKCMIKRGFTEIDIYGCDSRFKRVVESYTSNFVEQTVPSNFRFTVEGWNRMWNSIIKNNPQVKINFIKGNHE